MMKADTGSLDYSLYGKELLRELPRLMSTSSFHPSTPNEENELPQDLCTGQEGPPGECQGC